MPVTNRLSHLRPFAHHQPASSKPGQESSARLIAVAFGAMVVISGIYVLVFGVN